MKTIFRHKAKGPCLHPEKDPPNLAGLIFEREINMSGGRNTEIGNLTFNPEIGKLPLKQILDLLSKLGDREDISDRGFPYIAQLDASPLRHPCGNLLRVGSERWLSILSQGVTAQWLKG